MYDKQCKIPFTGLSISPRGVVRACCNQMDANMIKWANIKDLDDNVPWPTNSIQLLQEKMKAENPVPSSPECNRCWKQEELGLTSYRNHYDKIFFDQIDTSFEPYVDSPKLKYLDIQFGFLCNLSCAMCAPSLSSGLQATRMKMISITDVSAQKDFYKSSLNIFNNRDWTTDEQSFNKLKELSEDITSLKISGGEPFFNPRFKDFLKFLVNKSNPISFLHITTNGTIFDKDILELLKVVPNLEFRFSLESMEEEDEFIRWPTNWEDKTKNINQYLSQLNSNNYANICLQSLNLFSFDRTVNFIKNLPYNVTPLHNVLSPSDIASLYRSDIDYIQEYLDTTTNKESPMFDHALEAIKYNKSKVKNQAIYFKDFAKVQNKDLDKIFPIWYKYHSKYF